MGGAIRPIYKPLQNGLSPVRDLRVASVKNYQLGGSFKSPQRPEEGFTKDMGLSVNGGSPING